MKKLLYILPLFLLIILTGCDTSDIQIENHEYHASYNETHHFEACECGDKQNEEEHHFEAPEIIFAATCTKDGKQKLTCRCGYVKEEIIPAHGHNVETIKAKDPTCEDTGLTVGEICTICNVILKEQETVSKTNHNLTEWITETPATCITLGKQMRECTNCDFKEYKDIPMIEHNIIEGTKLDSTCTTHGHTAGTYCSYCKKTFEEQQELPLADHDFKPWEIDTEATCIALGKEKRICKDCDAVEYRDVEMIDHDIVETNPVESTCTTHGHTAGSYCDYCKQVFTKEEELPLANHSFTSWTEDTPATCIAKGKEVRTCSSCGLTEYQDIPIKDHNIVEIPAVESTCTTKGHTAGTQCDYCKKVFIETEELPLASHDYGEWEEETPATCITLGKEIRTCNDCGAVDYQDIEILGHDIVETEAVASTCTEKGHTAGSYCDYCNRVFVAEEELPLADHSYSSICHVTIEPTYTSVGNGYYICDECGYNLNVEVPVILFDKNDWQTKFTKTSSTNTTIEMDFYDEDLNKNLKIKMINYGSKYYISIKDNNINQTTNYYYSGQTAYQSVGAGYKHMTYYTSDDLYIKYRDILITAIYNSSTAYDTSIKKGVNGLTSTGPSKNYKGVAVTGSTELTYNADGNITSIDLDYSSTIISATISYTASDIALPYANYHDFSNGETCTQCSTKCTEYSAYKDNFIVYYYVIGDNIQFEYEMDNDYDTPCVFEEPNMKKSNSENIITFTQNYTDSNGISKLLYVYVVGGTVLCNYDSDNMESLIGTTYISETDAGIKPDGSLEQIYFEIDDNLSIVIKYKGVSDSCIAMRGTVLDISGVKGNFYVTFTNSSDNKMYRIKYDYNIQITEIG